MNRKINLLQKKIRAEVIKEYLTAAGQDKCICFTSGNAGKALKKVGLKVITVGENEPLLPLKWFSYNEIAELGLFDATSGHLPMPLIVEIAQRLKKKLKKLDKIELPTGSGETLLCLKLAFPQAKITAVYNLDRPTHYSNYAPLNSLVELLADSIKK